MTPIKLIALFAFTFSAYSAQAQLWQKALQTAEQGKGKESQSLLSEVVKSKQVSQDKLDLAKARVYFQDGEFNKALDFYDRVPKSSDYWLEALEEKAWTQLRLKNYDQTLSVLQTLLAPVLAPQVGPESHVLASLTYLKTCEYSLVFKTIEQFKERYRPRLKKIEELAITGTNEVADSALEKLARGPVTYAAIGKSVEFLPRLFYRDEKIQVLLAQKRQGAPLADSLLKRRLQELAKAEVKDYQAQLTKLHLIEAEAIQRVHSAQKSQDVTQSEFPKGSDVVKFPHSADGEVWLDELDSYQVRTAECPTAPHKTQKVSGK